MTKSKTWEEQLGSLFGEDFVYYPEYYEKLKSFVASQIEKTRREAYEEGVKEGWSNSVQDALDKTDYESGFKAGYLKGQEDAKK